MKTISFKLMPYINGRGEVSEDYKELTLFVDGNRWCSDSVSVYNWEHMEHSRHKRPSTLAHNHSCLSPAISLQN